MIWYSIFNVKYIKIFLSNQRFPKKSHDITENETKIASSRVSDPVIGQNKILVSVAPDPVSRVSKYNLGPRGNPRTIGQKWQNESGATVGTILFRINGEIERSNIHN